MTPLSIQRTQLESPEATGLIDALNAEITERYPEEGANFFHLDPAEIAPGHGAFFVAYVEAVAAGCGAVRRLSDDTSEIKRMYVVPALRGRGIARALLTALEAEAKSLGLKRLVLETGERQPEALGLYRQAGFTVIPAYGEYIDAPLSLCMGKDLS
ncbi:MAG: GNAT family N-acetyltransferase [Chloroflexi bacterium]|nr:GNAT family N-acetyltransferase [Chloroflexota bacterium]